MLPGVRGWRQGITLLALAAGVALLVWSPLSGGYLSGKYTAGNEGVEAGRRTNLNFPPIDPARVDPIVVELREVAREVDSTTAQVALAWVLGRDEVTSVSIGARSSQQLSDNLGAMQLLLSPGQREQLDRVSQTSVPYPYWMQKFHDKDRVVNI